MSVVHKKYTCSVHMNGASVCHIVFYLSSLLVHDIWRIVFKISSLNANYNNESYRFYSRAKTTIDW